MKILRIVSSGYEEGGVENGIKLAQPTFEEKGHIVKIFSSDSRSDLEHFNHYSYKSPSGTFFGRFLHTFNIFAYRELKRALREFNPDIVSVHTIGNASPAILLPLKKYPTVYVVHGPEFFIKSLRAWCFPKRYFKNSTQDLNNLNWKGKLRYIYFSLTDRLIYKIALKNVDIFVVLSGYMHRLLLKDGIENSFVQYGTKLMDYIPLKKEETKNDLLYVGRLEIFKGVDYLVDSMQEIVKKYPDAKLRIAGDGTEKENLISLTKKLKLENSIEFMGHVNRDGIEKLYIDSSILVVPSVWDEAFGKIGIEAMSVGRPIIASNVGGISDWLKDGENGYLIEPRQSQQISDSVIKLFSDKDLLIKMGNKGRELSLDFEISKYVDRMINVYESAINSRKHR